ncbi:hypothetical protein GALL_443560 [mine drainage metagenome]|uniref:Uncharacterized protein n=1 Tax=mine drainage metagenome TaxID=410659 RepID=A0A1J5PR75_9ZZZZ
MGIRYVFLDVLLAQNPAPHRKPQQRGNEPCGRRQDGPPGGPHESIGGGPDPPGEHEREGHWERQANGDEPQGFPVPARKQKREGAARIKEHAAF